MAKGINKVILIGNMGAEPETRYLPSGGAVTNIRLATSESWKDKNTGQQQERTEWHRVVFFNRLAEIAGEYLHKGSKVYIEGALRTRKWQDKEGKRAATRRRSSPTRCRCSTAAAPVAAAAACPAVTTTVPAAASPPSRASLPRAHPRRHRRASPTSPRPGMTTSRSDPRRRIGSRAGMPA